MSDDTPTPEKPTIKTATVPLKKETVRITLRAKPTSTAPVEVSSSSNIPIPPGAAPQPQAANSPTIPLRPAAPRPPGAPMAPAISGVPTVPLRPVAPRPPGAPMAPAIPGTPTTLLRPMPGASQPLSAPVALVTGLQTTPLRPGTSPNSAPLPTATRPLTTPRDPVTRNTVPPAISQDLNFADEEEESADPNSKMTPFGALALVASLIVLGVSLWSSDKTGMMDPAANTPSWETKSFDGAWRSNFKNDILVDIPTPVEAKN